MARDKSLLDILDSLFSQSKIIEYHGSRAVMKKYSYEPGLVKWLFIRLLSSPLKIYPFTLDPRERMEREVGFFTYKPGGVRTPRVYEENWEELYIIREYIEGDSLKGTSPPSSYAAVAAALAKIHSSRRALGDTKFTNFLINGDEVAVIDAEQAVETGNALHYSWDIVVLLSTLAASTIKENPPWSPRGLYERFDAFLDAYIAIYGSEPVALIRNNKRIKALLALLMPPPYSMYLQKAAGDKAGSP